MPERQYLCIDQKSFYATVECVARGLDPMTTNLVVADPDRSRSTICLAISPSMKALGIKNRCRMRDIPPNIPHIVAPPRMQLYIESKSLSSSQVLMLDYRYEEAEVIVKEMMDQLCLDMAAQKYVTDSISLFVGYSLSQGVFGAGGSVRLTTETNVANVIVPAVAKLYRRITNPTLAIRRIGLSCNDVREDTNELQLNMFEDVTKQLRNKALQETMLSIRAKYGKNSILKGVNFDKAATGRERNEQIGGHKGGKDKY